MTGFIKFTEMNLKMLGRDYQMIFWSIMFPVVLMSLLGVAFGSINEVTFKVAIIDEDDSFASKLFIDNLEDVSALDVDSDISEKRAKEEMKNGNMDLIIIIPEGFEKSIMNIESNNNLTNQTDLTDGDDINNLDSELPFSINVSGSEQINITVFYNDANADNAFSALAIVEKIITGMNKQLTGREDVIVIVPEKSTGGDFDFIDYIAPGILAMSIMQTGIYGMSMFIVSAREKGILKRLKATPVSPAHVLTTRILVSLVVAGLQTVILLIIAVFVFDVKIVGSWLMLGSMVVMGSVVFIMLGFIISSVSKTTESAESFSGVISMPMMFLGDVFIPISVLPGYIQIISKAMPLTYLSDTYRKIMLHGSGWEDIWLNVVILSIFGLVMFIGAVKLFRWEK